MVLQSGITLWCKVLDVFHRFKIKISGTYFDRHFGCWRYAAFSWTWKNCIGRKHKIRLFKRPEVLCLCLCVLWTFFKFMKSAAHLQVYKSDKKNSCLSPEAKPLDINSLVIIMKCLYRFQLPFGPVCNAVRKGQEKKNLSSVLNSNRVQLENGNGTSDPVRFWNLAVLLRQRRFSQKSKV